MAKKRRRPRKDWRSKPRKTGGAKHAMDPENYKMIIETIGLTQHEAAQLLDYSPHHGATWASSDKSRLNHGDAVTLWALGLGVITIEQVKALREHDRKRRTFEQAKQAHERRKRNGEE